MGKMTKKDYEMVADAICQTKANFPRDCDEEFSPKAIFEDLVGQLCREFKKDNMKFDSDKFRRACE